MSGGSYNYLCSRDPEELVHCEEAIEEMVNRLKELNCWDLAVSVETLHTACTIFLKALEDKQDDLQSVLHDVEWYDSCDIGLEELKGTIKKWYDKHNRPYPEIKDPRRK